MTRNRIESIARAKLLAVAALGVLLAAFDPAHAQNGNVTVFPCPVTQVTTGGTAVTVIPGVVNGGLIANFPDATENLFVDQTKAATTTESATNYPLQAGQPWFFVPRAMGPAGSPPPGVSVNAASSTHKFFCIFW